MDTIYYRKIAEIALRDGGPKLHAAAVSALTQRRISRRDRRVLRAFMVEWCDRMAAWPKPTAGNAGSQPEVSNQFASREHLRQLFNFWAAIIKRR